MIVVRRRLKLVGPEITAGAAIEIPEDNVRLGAPYVCRIQFKGSVLGRYHLEPKYKIKISSSN